MIPSNFLISSRERRMRSSFLELRLRYNFEESFRCKEDDIEKNLFLYCMKKVLFLCSFLAGNNKAAYRFSLCDKAVLIFSHNISFYKFAMVQIISDFIYMPVGGLLYRFHRKIEQIAVIGFKLNQSLRRQYFIVS